MKLFVLAFISAVSPLILGSCQEKLEWTIGITAGDIGFTEDDEVIDTISYEEIMPLDAIRPSPQGGDCWGDYFFQFTANNLAVRVYDLSTKTLVQTIKLTSSLIGFVTNCHCNSVNFGTEYYDAEDVFPLIYVSTGNAAGGYSGSLVYRITQHNGIFCG